MAVLPDFTLDFPCLAFKDLEPAHLDGADGKLAEELLLALGVVPHQGKAAGAMGAVQDLVAGDDAPAQAQVVEVVVVEFGVGPEVQAGPDGTFGADALQEVGVAVWNLLGDAPGAVHYCASDEANCVRTWKSHVRTSQGDVRITPT